jgi:hypothetical protein
MSIERFETIVDRMAELHSEQDTANTEGTAENVLELENLRLERRDLEARLGDRLDGVRGYRGSPGRRKAVGQPMRLAGTGPGLSGAVPRSRPKGE